MHPYALRLHPGQDIKNELYVYYFKNIMVFLFLIMTTESCYQKVNSILKTKSPDMTNLHPEYPGH